jgi:antitoxin YefM
MYNFDMDAISYSEARASLAKVMDKVCDDHEPFIITRRGKRSVVLLSLEDYEALGETAYLRRSPLNAKRLSKAIRELEAGKGLKISAQDLAS